MTHSDLMSKRETDAAHTVGDVAQVVAVVVMIAGVVGALILGSVYDAGTSYSPSYNGALAVFLASIAVAAGGLLFVAGRSLQLLARIVERSPS